MPKFAAGPGEVWITPTLTVTGRADPNCKYVGIGTAASTAGAGVGMIRGLKVWPFMWIRIFKFAAPNPALLCKN